MKESLYRIVPDFIQNFLIYLYNKIEYKIRYGGEYWKYRIEKEKNRELTREELLVLQSKRYEELIRFVVSNSEFYRNTLANIDNVLDIKHISNLPITSKEVLRNNIDKIIVKTSEKLLKSKTGGTTGKSLEVRNFARNAQERFAFLDDFRSRFGYELGKKTAWFSGKNLLTERDIKRNRFWKTDSINNVRYYSTFHIKSSYLKYYVEDMIKYSPEYLVGFPSTMLEIAKFGLSNGYKFKEGIIKAIFPTAETITAETRSLIEEFYNTKLYNQYASSEGAPFIFECINGNLHLELQSGVFEVLDENSQPVESGRLVVTSFTTEGTPLIRYDIGDSITLEDCDMYCTCGNNNPLVKEILGRVDDYVYSPENGKINLGNVSNTLKDTYGIIKFQVIQDDLNILNILLVVDDSIYNDKIEKKFIQNWKDRVGNQTDIKIKYVDDIVVEKSGKYRMVKNNIKHLISS